MEKFTNGKRKVRKGNVRRLEYAATVSCDKEVIHCSCGMISDSESIANAYLIAAAPEMYAKLKEIAEEGRNYESRGGNIPSWCNEVEELLAKARGE
jgi:hypothetical protein